jgi:hypothetical protein
LFAEVLFRWSGQELDITGWGVIAFLVLIGSIGASRG